MGDIIDSKNKYDLGGWRDPFPLSPYLI